MPKIERRIVLVHPLEPRNFLSGAASFELDAGRFQGAAEFAVLSLVSSMRCCGSLMKGIREEASIRYGRKE
jgi:hypothetical protein